jgi:hypothetical protein
MRTRVPNIISYHHSWHAYGEINAPLEEYLKIFWGCNSEIKLNGEKVKFRTCDDYNITIISFNNCQGQYFTRKIKRNQNTLLEHVNRCISRIDNVWK